MTEPSVVLQALERLTYRLSRSIGPVILLGDLLGFVSSAAGSFQRQFARPRVGRGLLGNITGKLAQQ